MLHHYKGHTIELIPGAEGLMWACQYVIKKFNQTEIAGFPDGNTYDTRENGRVHQWCAGPRTVDLRARRLPSGADGGKAVSRSD